MKTASDDSSDPDEMDHLPHEHKFVHLRTAKWIGNDGGYSTQFIRVDTFFCERCLDQKEVRKETYSRDTPEWYRGE